MSLQAGPLCAMVLRRSMAAIPTLLGVVVLVFLLVHLVPGDPLDALLGERATPTDRAAMAATLGLDKPLFTQFLHYISGLVQGNLGHSLSTGKPVLTLIAERMPATGQLALGAMLVAVGLGVPAGIATALLRGKAHTAADMALIMLVAIPTFCSGPLLIMLLAVQLNLLPVSGADSPASIVLPSLTLGFGLAAALGRMVAHSLAEHLAADYIKTVAAKGGSRLRAVLLHALRNAWLPVVVVFCLQLGMVLTGAVLTEAVFGWPGVGNVLVESLHARDYPVLQGCILLIGLTYMATSLLADVINYVLDPRVRS
jgi:ABC-type dipeptide/oligopeptide/nickel transport system permease component